MAGLWATEVAFALSVFATGLAANTVATSCPANSQLDACQEAGPAGDTLLATRKGVLTQVSAQEEAALRDEVRQGSGAAEQQRQQEAAVVADRARSNTSHAAESDVEEVNKGMCKHAKIKFTNAVAAFSANKSTIYPFVKVSYKGKQSQDLTFETYHKKAPPIPVVWDYMKEVLLCDKEQPLHFEIYDKGYFHNTLLAKASLDAFQFWETGFDGTLNFEDGAEGYLQVTVQI